MRLLRKYVKSPQVSMHHEPVRLMNSTTHWKQLNDKHKWTALGKMPRFLCLTVKLVISQNSFYRLVQEYQDNRIELISTLKNTFRRIIVERESENPQKIKQMIEDINRLDEKFNAMTEKIWYNVMESELSLHERIDERIRSFSQVIKEMVKEFAENLQLLFMNLRNVCNEYFGKLQESAMNYLKHGQHRDNLPEELKKVKNFNILRGNFMSSHKGNNDNFQILCSGVGIKNFFSQNHNHLKENFQNRIDSLTKKLNSWETDLIADQHKYNYILIV